ncbi:MAX dimerization protein [Sarotherodon galilaeus]
MFLLSLAWLLLTGPLWTSDSKQILLEEEVSVRYPKILSNETIDCDCGKFPCDAVFWLHSDISGKVQFLGKCNNADRVTDNVDERHFKLSKRGSKSFTLRIITVTKEDRGIYSCVLKDKSLNEMWKPGTLLLPGETPPTPPPKPKPKPPSKPTCRCNTGDSKGGCGSMILWPLVGLLGGLALAVLCTLRYFSRLPRKCHHHFPKKRQTF